VSRSSVKRRECDGGYNEGKVLFLQNVQMENLDQYDIIFIGGPIWWGHIPASDVHVE
jgi:multimeric flavodoxin WrbA